MIDAVAFLQELVEIESLSGQERPLADFLTRQMAEWGYTSHIDPAGNAVGVRERPHPDGRLTRTIVLLGHMDTVPGRIPVRVVDGRLYGRGTVDAKGPLAAFVVAGATADLPPGTRLIVIGATEEECATSRGARYAATQYQPDFCLIGEPSGWQGITLGYKGRVLLDYELAQPMGHTAGPNAGPAEAAVTFWNTLQAHCHAFNADKPKLFDQLLPSIRSFQTASDGLTDSVSLKLGFRLPPNYEVQELITTAERARGTAAIRFHAHEPAYQSTRATPLYAALGRAIRQHGGQPTPKLKTGTADMNIVGQHWPCPILAYGPGDSQLDHTPEEHVVLEEYGRSIAILKDLLAFS